MKFGLLGYGVMGKIRHEVIDCIPGHSVAKVYDPCGQIRLNGVEVVEDYREILDDDKIGGVFICVPNYLIAKYVIESLRRGKHVFCEKPPGISAAEVMEMIKEEKKHPKLKLMFGFNHRHHESIIRSKELIDSGKYGKLLWMRGRYGKSVPPNFQDNWRSKKNLSGGGIFLDQGIHMLDLFLMMCGDFQEVKAFVSNLYWKADIEDNVFALFKNHKGQVASLHSTMTQWRHLFSLEMFLQKGYLTVNGLITSSGSYGEEQLTIAENRTAPPAATWTEEEKFVYRINSSWEKEVKIFLDSIENDKEVPVANTQDALKLMKLVDAVYAQK
ncbi:MAG: Gfo/Idh/MocA family oxidoreductase [Candidatus Margulisbacteria bacterium]|nr:Gfo/Idh/MocA family oxidoreductase [Candidatus Margulisiibacteriota bacterium]MBU1617112.1 Gfo/Idh/MocA family oxidoreductase [Candidatus Margulisiibacteriota bacterium]